MFTRIKRIIKLSGKSPEAIEALTDDQIEELPNVGDGNAVFIGEGTHEEFEEQQREDEGTKSWYDRIRRLGKTETVDGNE